MSSSNNASRIHTCGEVKDYGLQLGHVADDYERPPARPCRKMGRGHPSQALEVSPTGMADAPWPPVAVKAVARIRPTPYQLGS